MKTALRRIYFGLILFLMYAPIVTLVVLSFNASKSRTKWGGFTLSWYVSLFQDEAIMSALYNTLVIAWYPPFWRLCWEQLPLSASAP